MTDQNRPGRPRRRWLPALLIAVAVVVIGAAVAVALTSGGRNTAAGPGSTPSGSASATSSGPAAPSVAASATPRPSTVPSLAPTPSSAPTPQPTKTAEITKSKPQTIKKSFTVRVTKAEAVKGEADGPGEIGGPSVRFTIRIENTTGKSVSLIDTVVNAYYGKDQTPAVPLRKPGGTSFPTKVKDGGSASGVYLFNIPVSQRGDVQVTVDTSVKNPVIAFQGAAPKS